MSNLPHAMTGDEIDEAAEAHFAESFDDWRFREFLARCGISREEALRIFRLGFMCGGEAATQRVQDYVDAGGTLEKST